MEQETYVYLDFTDEPRFVGRLWTRVRQGRESASFQYDQAWLSDPERFALEPALILGPGAHHTTSGKALFGSLGDSAPDRWGRALMTRAERQTARTEDRATRTLTELDYLLRVSDPSRQGALRFKAHPEGPFLGDPQHEPVPPLIELPRLLAASDRLTTDEGSDELLTLLLAPGSSLGGARPKASVLDNNGTLSIAKFPKRDDEYDTVRWESVALTLADNAGIAVPLWRLEPLDDRFVLIIQRFDRENGRRLPFLSAMSMVGATDGETRSYLEIADALRQYGAATTYDLQQLWRRIVFSVLISNTDDHLRNHAFIYEGNAGWRLSPAYDLNPVPIDLKPRYLSTAIDLENTQASLELALSVASYFSLDDDEARAIAQDVAKTVSDWRLVASNLGLTSAAIERMSSAFEHNDLSQAIAL